MVGPRSVCARVIDAAQLTVRIPSRLEAGQMLQLRDLLIEHPGEVPVVFDVKLNDRRIRITPEDRFRVRFDTELTNSIEELLGKGAASRI